MEDILASIRRILNEDEADLPAAASAPASPPLAAPAMPPEDDVLQLDSGMMVSEGHIEPEHDRPEDPAPAAMLAQSTAAADHPAPAPEPPAHADPFAFEPSPAPHPIPEAAPLLAPEAEQAAASAVAGLRRALVDRGTVVHRGGPTIEDLVREELRPILKEWLDSNLPALVERLVRAEIERLVARTVG